MRKTFFAILCFLISVFIFGQNREYRKAVNLFNQKQYTEANVLVEELLNEKYGSLNNEQKYYCLAINSNCYYFLNDYKTAYVKAEKYLAFVKDNKGMLQDSDRLINDIIKFIGDLKQKIPIESNNSTSLVKLDTNSGSITTEKSTTIADEKPLEHIVAEEKNNLAVDTKEQIVEKPKTESNDKTVFITVNGSGKTLDEAKQSAFRSAVEQAYGTFISTKTEIFNDQLVTDQMSSVSSGNIQSFEMLNETQLPNGNWGVTLKAVVSVTKLASFAEAKGYAVEIKGGLFALNIKQQLLNEQGEIQAITNMFGVLHEIMQTAFDYSLNTGTPQSTDAESKNWEIPLNVMVTANKNIDIAEDYLIKTLSALSLSSSEMELYNSLNKKVYSINISDNNIKKTFYLRKYTSMKILTTLVRNWEGYLRMFSVNSGIDETHGKGEKFDVVKFYEYDLIKFPPSGKLCSSFKWNDKKTLTQIDKIEKYTVRPRGTMSKYKHGGFFIEQEGHSSFVLNIFNNERYYEHLFSLEETLLLEKECKELSFNGYNDWRLPTSEELELIKKSGLQKIYGLFSEGYNDFRNYYYSSDKKNISFDDEENIFLKSLVRCVRSF